MKRGMERVCCAVATFAIVSATGLHELRAANINTAAAACAPSGTFLYQSDGVKNTGTTAGALVCPVPRSKLDSTATAGAFYIDGSNPPGAASGFGVYSVNYDGTILATQSVASSAANYDILVSFTAAQLPTYAYVVVVANIPKNGVFRGVTSLQ